MTRVRMLGAVCMFAGVAVMACAPPALADRTFTLITPAGGCGGGTGFEVAADPPLPESIACAELRPATTGGECLRLLTEGDIFIQVLPEPAENVVVTGPSPPGAWLELQLEFPINRTEVIVETDGLGRTVYRLVTSSPAGRAHIGDFNRDRIVSVQDIFDFLGAYARGSPSADVDADGTLQVQDLFAFMGGWFGG